MAAHSHWRLNDNAASTAVAATVGSNGTLNGGDNTSVKHTVVSWRGGDITSAFDLNGSDDSITVSGIDFQEFSFAAWIKLDAVPAPLIGLGSASNAESIRVVDDTTVGVTPNSGDLLFTVPSLGTTNPHRIVITRDSLNDVRCYVDGVESETGAQNNTGDWRPTHIGRRNAVFFDGQIAEVSVWDHALSQQEINDDFDDSGTGGEMAPFTGIGGTSSTSAKYRCRVDKVGSLLQIEYSTASDLSGSTTSTGITVTNDNDRVMGEEITGLTAGTRHYYSIVIDGARKHSAPFPSFKTLPTSGPIKLAFSSCMANATEAFIFASIAAEEADLFLSLGDFGYINSTALVDLRRSYRVLHAADYMDVVTSTACVHVYDDHDFGGNNSDGDQGLKANSKQVLQEYMPCHTMANGSQGIWRNFMIGGDVEVFVLDVRYQREGVLERFPAASTLTADTGSGGTTLVLRAADSPSGSDDAYNTWYVEVEGVIRRITDYVAATRSCALSADVPGLGDASIYYLRRASMLDMDGIANGQANWLIDGLNNSTALWKLVVTSSIWSDGQTNPDTWGGWDTDKIERKYILQETADVDNIVAISADRHGLAIDNGTNSEWPEITASPLNQDVAGVSGSWTQGIDNTGHMYGVVDINGNELTLTGKDADGTTNPNVTPLTIEAVPPPSPQALFIRTSAGVLAIGV